MNPIALTTKQTQENLKTLWNRVGISEEEKAWLHREKLNKLWRAKDEKNAIAHSLQKAWIDKLKEKNMNFQTTTTFAQSLPVTLRSREQLILSYLKEHLNIKSWNEHGQMIKKMMSRL